MPWTKTATEEKVIIMPGKNNNKLSCPSEEWCPECDSTVVTDRICAPCPSCGKPLTACSCCLNCTDNRAITRCPACEKGGHHQENGDLHVLMPLQESVTEEAVNYAAHMLPEPEGTRTETNIEAGSETPQEQFEPEQEKPEPEEQTRPQSENPRSKEPIVMTKEKQPVSRNETEAGQQFEDPMKELNRLIAETQETVRIVNNNMREIKKQATAAERHVRNEEKKIRSHEQDMAKNLKLIEKLQESVAA